MLGRPVARHLIRDGFTVRAMVRDKARAGRVLPDEVELASGDVFDPKAMHRAMEGCHAVYVNLATPCSPRKRNVELAGVPHIINAARAAGVQRVLKISAMGVGIDDHGARWWALRDKSRSDEALIDSGLAYTVFRPTWFTESIALFRMGRSLIVPPTPDEPLFWITGDDYARQVSAAMRSDRAANRIYTMQGAHGVSMSEAVARFAKAHPRKLSTFTLPRIVLPALSLIASQPRYLRDLLDMTYLSNTTFAAQETFDELGRAEMIIEDYVQYMLETGDVPRK